ncbi:abortive infection system antitoxin AbiGi family protein [Enterobacter asburiae]|uniref:abortive infection system antitoxin AbiGi family protein n=1 Tax=Enterobacter asburiae TaxID=61645 RepID=UPI002003872D|nr:abortive infection system antitoxin AbiGi family protein [Enterobacter asburiae]MCK6655564.1 abortive infection system antitoxin AbiGi family protein [Enterobacter asburiae]
MESTKSLHPSTLFHFTKKADVFFQILSEMKFKPSLAREMLQGKGIGGRRNFAVPMVSFCDIRVTHLDEHTRKYGEFGLGLTKEWAERNNLHPVLYMSKESDLFSLYNKRIRTLKNKLVPLWNSRKSLNKLEQRKFERLKSEYSDLYNLLRYMKNYKGRLIQDGQLKNENFIFADEKEWRYVPEPFAGDRWPSLNLEKVKSSEQKRLLSEKFSDLNISFTFDDVKYILIPNDSYLSGVLNVVNYFDVENGHSKILTMSQVKADF